MKEHTIVWCEILDHIMTSAYCLTWASYMEKGRALIRTCFGREKRRREDYYRAAFAGGGPKWDS